jgi:hypothetical protein
MSLQLLLPILVEKLGAEDLEGIEHLPEEMRPSLSQKPQVVKNPPESSEEVNPAYFMRLNE